MTEPADPRRQAAEAVHDAILKAQSSEKARFQVGLLTAWAERDGGELGKSVINQMLEPHKDCPAGSRAEVNRGQLDELVRKVLDQLCQQKFPPVKLSESRSAFLKAFRASADAAIGDFNERKAVKK
jgi:hypothetical protein